LIFAIPGQAQQSLLTRHVRDVTLNGQTQPVGHLPATQIMQLDIVLPLSDQAGLDKFLSELYDPASPSYRHFLTVAEFTAKFGPSQADYNAVVDFAKANGLTVVGGTRDGMDVQVKGPVSAVESALHLNLRTYQHPTENRAFYAPDREPAVNLPFRLWHISGLDNYSIPHTRLVKKSDYAQAHGITAEDLVSQASTGSGPSASFLGSDMRAAYYGGTTLTGAGQSLGLLEFAGTDLADLATYYNNIGQTMSVPITLLSVDGTSTSCTCSVSKCTAPGTSPACEDIEQALDLTQALGMAPGLSSLVMYIGSDDTPILSAMTTHNPLPTSIGCSWGWTPVDPSVLDPYFEKMAAQGQNFFAASGDHSTWSASNEAWPADDANVVSVGGTDLVTTGAAGAWQSETAWGDSGGGISPDSIPIPAWQQLSGVINSSNQGSTLYRNGPDVAANANWTFYVCANQAGCTANEYGGTSFAAPMWAGYLALLNQQLADFGEPAIGYINPTIYAQNVTSAYATDFHDITSGTSGSYSAVTGYDLVTGWGSPNGQGLMNALAPPAQSFLLSASPGSLTIGIGGAGTTTITVQAVDGFTGSVTLAASGLPSGVTASFSTNPATGSSVLTLTASSSAAAGTNNVTVTGAAGTLTATTTVALTVSPVQVTAPSAVNFGAVNVGSTSPATSMVFTFVTSGELGGIGVLTQGATGLDFADAGSDTCAANTVYAAGQTCTVNVTFTPQFSGTRFGAVVLEDNSGNALAAGYLQGTGVGPQINFLPAAKSEWSNGLPGASGVAVDGSGNVYIAGVGTVVHELLAVNGIIPASPTVRALGSGFDGPTGVAVDGGGNVYVADFGNSAVKELLAVNGSIPASPTIETLGSGFNHPFGVAVDGNGNVFVADRYNSEVKEILAVNGSIPASPTINTLGSGFNQPDGVAVDGNGNVYVADTLNNAVKELLAVDGSVPPTPTIETLGSGFIYPFGVAVDGNGNVYVADYDNNAVKEILAVNGSIPASPTINTLGGSFVNPTGVAVVGTGNVYVAEWGDNRVDELNFAVPPSLSFASTAYGATSTDSPQTVTIENTGNAALSFPVPSTGNNPGITANFTLNSSGASACPLLSAASSTAGTLAPGASCLLPISFTPAAEGALSGSLALTDNNLNAAGPGYALQSITLSGTGIQATPTITWTTPAAITYGTALSATQLNASSTVTGSFTYSPVAGTVLGAGQQTLTVSFAPTDSTNYTNATASVTLTVNQATPAITWATPAAITYGTALSATQLNASSTVAGGFTYSPAAGTVLGAGQQTLTASFAPTDSTDYTNATATVQLTVNPAAQTISFPAITATEVAATTLPLSATATSGLAVSFASTTPTVCTVSGTTASLLISGTCTIQATQAGNSNYSAAMAQQSFAVHHQTQTITFPAITGTQYATTTLPLSATASSGLTVAFVSTTPAVCTVSGATASLLTAGTCIIQASQAGNAAYALAPSVSQYFTVHLEPQTISFPAITASEAATTTLGLSASATSTLAVVFASTTPTVCTVAGSTATLLISGTCVIQATQPGNNVYAAAPMVTQSFAVHHETQTITFPAITGTQPAASTIPLTATASSGLTVAFASTTPAICTVSGATASLLKEGTCGVDASQAGNAAYSVAPTVGQSFKVGLGPQTITFPAITGTQYVLSQVTLTATASSGLTVTYTSASPAVCTVLGATATLVTTGSCVIHANQAGNTTYSVAPQVAQYFTVSPIPQTISFPAITATEVATTTLGLSATASSGLTVAFASTTPAVCTVAGATASLLISGTCVIQATQPGNSDYTAAPMVSQSFAVHHQTQTITFPSIGSQVVGAQVTLSATASSGLAVSFATTTSTVCTVAGSTATMLATGNCVIQATQAGNAAYAVAPGVSQYFAVKAAPVD
jgi:kumamolisin